MQPLIFPPFNLYALMAQIKKSLIGRNGYVRWNLHSLRNCCLHNAGAATGRREGGELPPRPRAAAGAAELGLGAGRAEESAAGRSAGPAAAGRRCPLGKPRWQKIKDVISPRPVGWGKRMENVTGCSFPYLIFQMSFRERGRGGLSKSLCVSA